METKTEDKKQQWKKNSISSASSSRCSSISSDSSDGHFDIKLFPLPKPVLSASELQKQREFHHMYNSFGSSWSSNRFNNLVDFPGYDPNRIPSSVFSTKPANSTEWSIASNESLFSIHDANFFSFTKEDQGLSPGMRLSEIPRIEEPVHEITEINPVPLPPVKKPKESEKKTITEKGPSQSQVEKSDSEIDDHEEEEEKMTELESKHDHEDMTKLESDDNHEEEKQNKIKAEVKVETETDNPKPKEKKPRDSSSTVSHSPSVSCRSENSTNSIGSFAFPLLQKEDAEIRTPSMIIKKGNVSHKQSSSYQLPKSPRQPPKPQTQPQTQPQRKASKLFKSQTLSLKNSRTRWFSCFDCSSNCGLFK